MFDIFKILPKAFSTYKAIFACIEGGATKEEIQAAVAEFRDLLAAIPALRGILAIFDIVISFVDKIIPDLIDNPEKMDELGVDPDTVQQVANVSTLFKDVMKDAKDSGKFNDEMRLSDVDDMV